MSNQNTYYQTERDMRTMGFERIGSRPIQIEDAQRFVHQQWGIEVIGHDVMATEFAHNWIAMRSNGTVLLRADGKPNRFRSPIGAAAAALRAWGGR